VHIIVSKLNNKSIQVHCSITTGEIWNCFDKSYFQISKSFVAINLWYPTFNRLKILVESNKETLCIPLIEFCHLSDCVKLFKIREIAYTDKVGSITASYGI